MKYRYKPAEIEAVQFRATPQDIANIATFGGSDFTGVNLNGNPLPVAFVDGLVIPEGSWLLRNASGMYKVLKDSVFTAVCERVPAATPVVVQPAPAVIAEVMEPAPAVFDGMPAITSREEARAAGAIRFFTGEPCKHGHVSERYTASNHCVQCAKDAVRKHAKLVKVRARKREWYQNNLSVAARERKATEAMAQSPAWLRPLASNMMQ